MVDVGGQGRTQCATAMRRGPRHHAAGNAGAHPLGQRQEGRRARRGAHRRHHGRQEDARTDPALPSAAAHASVASTSKPDEALPGLRVTATGQADRPDRRRDGSADRRLRRLPDDLRHGQGGRPRHEDHRHPRSWKNPAASPAITGRAR